MPVAETGASVYQHTSEPQARGNEALCCCVASVAGDRPSMGTIEGAAVGAAVGAGSGVFVAALTSLGIPKEGIVRYQAELKANKFLLIATGTPADTEKARALLAQAGATEVQVHAR